MDNNTTGMGFQNQQITGDKVIGLVRAIGRFGLELVHNNASGRWMWTSDHAIPNFDLQRNYGTEDEAVTFLVGYLLNNDTFRTINLGVAA